MYEVTQNEFYNWRKKFIRKTVETKSQYIPDAKTVYLILQYFFKGQLIGMIQFNRGQETTHYVK